MLDAGGGDARKQPRPSLTTILLGWIKRCVRAPSLRLRKPSPTFMSKATGWPSWVVARNGVLFGGPRPGVCP